MPLYDSAALACIVDELQPLVGGTIQRIRQPEPLQVVLSIYKSGLGERHLLIDVSPRFYRAHLTSERVMNPPAPPPFCMTLRKYLNGGVITSIAQRAGDRILDLRVQNQEEEYLLSAELMGKHANLILVSPEGKVLHAAKLISSKQSRVRQVLPGREYSPPPAPRTFAPQEAKPCVTSAELDEKYRDATRRAVFEQEQSTLRGAISKTLSQKRYVLEQVRRGARESARAAEYRRRGELLLANLHEVKTQMEQGAGEAEVLDFYDEAGAKVKIPLDRNLSPQENANACFARARHVEENAAELRQLEEQLAREVAELEKFLVETETVGAHSCAPDTTLETLQHLRQRAHNKNWLRATEQRAHSRAPLREAGQADFGGHKIKRFTSPDGFEVLVGESATANDYLVTRLSHSNDWWLHLRGGTSAHAIIKTHNAPDRVPRSTLLFAARLVVARSVAKHAGWAEVDYTLCKYVRKPRKAAPGAVVHTNAKTLHVEPEKG
jgi:predicted ribosome quality control (RQC) complex YloA/Tae2 family protein